MRKPIAGISTGFISVGAFCQQALPGWVRTIGLFVLRLRCLVKRKGALRGRNLSGDSQVEGAPMVHLASGVHVAPEAVFLTPIGHPSHASENPPSKAGNPLASGVRATSLGSRHWQVVARGCGIEFAIRRRTSGAAQRLDSSLRSHRTQRAKCRCVSSGLNKTLFAPVGPDSRGRSHRQAASRFRECFTRQAGWKNLSRGHRRGGTPPAERSPRPQGVTMMPQYADRRIQPLRRPCVKVAAE